MEKITENKNQIKIEIECERKKYRFQLTKDLWELLAESYTNIHNPITPQNEKKYQDAVNINDAENFHADNDEQKTEDSTSNDQNVTQSNDIMLCIDSQTNEQEKQPAVNDNAVEEEVEEEKQDVYKWNQKYKDNLDIMDEKERCKNIQQLVSEFSEMCKMHCIDIVENIIFSDNRTNDMFVRDEIEFKFICNDEEYYQTKLLIANWKQYMNAFDGQSEKIYCPLSCIIQYLNCKIFCKATASFMTEENLVFGRDISDNSFKFDENVSHLLDIAAQKLNLSSHSCKYDETIQISTSSNIKIYKLDDIYFMDNVAELYPVDIVHIIKDKETTNIKSKQYRARLDPQLIKVSGPVSSDAFVPPCDDKNDQIASKLIYNLHSIIIPKFAANINNLKIKILDGYHFRKLMLERGINMIYIGEVYCLCHARYAKEIISISMIGRIIKESVDMELITSKQAYQDKIDYYINCFTNSDDSYEIELDVKQKIISLTNDKYGVSLNTKCINKLQLKFVKHELQRMFNIVNDSNGNKYTFKSKIELSVCDVYTQNMYDDDEKSSVMVSIQRDFLKLKNEQSNITDCDKFEKFRNSCLELMNRIDIIFPFHAYKFDVLYIICETYQKLICKEENGEEMKAYCSSLFADCLNLSKFLFGSKHKQTLSIQIKLFELLHSSHKYSECIEEMEQSLKIIEQVFGKTSCSVSIILKLLSKSYMKLGNYDKAYQFGKQNILILDERKRFNDNEYDEYINAHLLISLIAEKTGDYGLGIRFLNKLYNHLKKQIEREINHKNKQNLWENVDIKVLCVSISRIKLKMCTENKLNGILKKWKKFHEDRNNDDNDNDIINKINKCKELLIQNLCLNPIKKSNDLLKDSAQPFDVICWINIIKEFEANFLKISQ